MLLELGKLLWGKKSPSCYVSVYQQQAENETSELPLECENYEKLRSNSENM